MLQSSNIPRDADVQPGSGRIRRAGQACMVGCAHHLDVRMVLVMGAASAVRSASSCAANGMAQRRA
jgi:hypothetical protein